MSDFWIHLEGCDKLRAMMRKTKQGHDYPLTERLLTIGAFSTLLSRSTDAYLAPKRWEEGSSLASLDYLLNTSPFCPNDTSLEFTYGISATLAHYMYLIIRSCQHLDYYEARDLSPPVSLRRAIATLGEALQTWSIDDEPLASVSRAEHETRSLVVCHVLAFHAALIIYLHSRTGWLDRHSKSERSAGAAVPDESVMRHYGRICVTNLLAAESLKSSCGDRAGWRAMAPIVWPGFIASCEAEPDERPLWRAWWTGVRQYRIGSIQALWDVVQEVWRRQQKGDSQKRPRWIEVLRRSGRRVMSG